MTDPLESARLIQMESVGSTQTLAKQMLAEGKPFGAILALEQTAGKGRQSRDWFSCKGGSLCASIPFKAYAGIPKPWLVGMLVALAAASEIYARVQWPNDLVLQGKKVGGVLVEMVGTDSGAQIPLVGLGINIQVPRFPEELQATAISLSSVRTWEKSMQQTLESILARLPSLPEPDDWSDVQPIWSQLDGTQGKVFRLPDGQRAEAIGYGPAGELMVNADGQTSLIHAADAWFKDDQQLL